VQVATCAFLPTVRQPSMPVKLAEHNRIELVWVLGHVGIDGSETVDHLARQVSAIPLTGPESSLGISAKVIRGLIRD